METGVASMLLVMLPLQALLLVAGLSAAAATGDDDMGSLIRLHSNDDDTTAALGKRPWKCCDMQPCTRSIPAICRCGDLLEHCSAACKHCSAVTGTDPPRYICNDIYRGRPAPRCHKGDAVLAAGTRLTICLYQITTFLSVFSLDYLPVIMTD